MFSVLPVQCDCVLLFPWPLDLKCTELLLLYGKERKGILVGHFSLVYYFLDSSDQFNSLGSSIENFLAANNVCKLL